MKILICDNERRDANNFKKNLKKHFPDTEIFITTDWATINYHIENFNPDIVLIDLYWRLQNIPMQTIIDLDHKIASVRNGIQEIRKNYVPYIIDSHGICALELIREKYTKTELPALIITRFGNFMLDSTSKKKAYSDGSGFLYKWDDPITQMAKINHVLGKPTFGGKTVFIGHGHSSLWEKLRDYLSLQLKLPWEEFNRESPAGVSITQRLEQMLSQAAFAFLVMTAEEENVSHTFHSRPNVIHEAGLFQGRLGFKRAVVMLEESCSEFSNITGLGQIRFPSGDISKSFDQVRSVLEREKMI